MLRVVFHLASVLSLVLLFACAGLWARSYFVQDEYRFGSRDLGLAMEEATGAVRNWNSQFTLSSSQGKCQVLRSESQGTPPGGRATTKPAALFSLSPDRPVDKHFSFAGVEYFDRPRHTYKQGDSTYTLWAFRYLTLPYWMLTTILLPLPIAWLVHVRRRVRGRRRLMRGLCAACGYDFRFSTDRCPECGALKPAPGNAPSSG